MRGNSLAVVAAAMATIGIGHEVPFLAPDKASSPTPPRSKVTYTKGKKHRSQRTRANRRKAKAK